MVLRSHHGPVSSGATSRAARPTAALAGWSRRSSAPMSDLPDAVWVCAAATGEDPAVVGEHDHQVFGVTLEPEPRLLDQAEPASQERQLPSVRLRLVEVDRPGPGLLCRGPSRAAGDSCTAWRWDRVAAVIDQQLRARARSSSRKLADLVREVVVQVAQRERVVALAMDDARGRVAEARAQAAEQALQAGPNRAGPTYRGPGPSPRRPGRTGASRRSERLSEGWSW
jgi:hypothetical protein